MTMFSFMLSLCVVAAISVAMGLLLLKGLREKNLGVWLWSYLKQRGRYHLMPSLSKAELTHILFCLVDHFEPVAAGSTLEQERTAMRDWMTRFPLLAKQHLDSDGRHPQHTWFYPAENYRSEYLDNLTKLCELGLGEVELHLHHGHDTSGSLHQKFETALSDFGKHGALITRDVPPRHAFAFIHGNMALDNSMNDLGRCGVNDEIRILRETGCFADFSMPTAPAISQTRKINTVFYAQDDPLKAKSHNTGVDVEVNGKESGDLMIIQGPLGLDWSQRKWGIIPKIENGEIQGSNPPSRQRIKNWIAQHVHVKGRPEWIIVKVSCHGAEERSRDVILGESADSMYSELENRYRDRPAYALHYVTARELYNIIKAAEAGLTGNPAEYLDYVIGSYQTHGERLSEAHATLGGTRTCKS